MTLRETRAALASNLASAGHTHREIAAMLGLTPSGVRNLIYDPMGEKQRARRERYRGTCEQCGAATDGSNGRALAPRICIRCDRERAHDERRWTRDSVLAAFAALNDLCVETLGRPIRAGDWMATYASHAGRYSDRRRGEADRLWAAAEERGLAKIGVPLIHREVGGFDEAKRLLGIDDSDARRGGSPTHRAGMGVAA